LLVCGEHRYGVAQVRVLLLAIALERRAHPRLDARALGASGRVAPDSRGAGACCRTQRVELYRERPASVISTARDRRQAHHLRIGELQLPGSCEQKLRGAADWATSRSWPHHGRRSAKAARPRPLRHGDRGCRMDEENGGDQL